jgi:hypothetical protein
MPHLDAVRRNIEWFQRSGVMRPPDGFWGVAERIAVLADNEAAEHILRAFPSHTRLAPGVVALEHRRADCVVQSALLFDLAAEALREPALRAVADNLLDYLLRRSCLPDADPNSPTCALWGWANPIYLKNFWTDDNSWVATLLLLLARRGRPELRAPGLAAARALHRHCVDFMTHVREKGKETPLEGAPVLGLRLNPHWFGLVAMTCAHAAAEDADTDYAPFVRDYHRIVLSGPPAYDRRSVEAARSGLPWAVSEYAYLALTASVCAARFRSPDLRDVARHAADTLLRFQAPDGHFRSEHYETPAGEHLADMIYTQNWATLGLYHAAKALDSAPYRAAFQRSAEFLVRIQDTAPEPWFRGCWRGLYDTRAGLWGGGDRYEGGQGSIYSGWTNAPISIALLLDHLGLDLFAPVANVLDTQASVR